MTAPWRFLPCANCCDEECLILHDPLAGPELSSAWEVVSGDLSFVDGVLRISSPDAIILANVDCELGNVGLQVNFKGYDRAWGDRYRLIPAVDQARLIFDYHSPEEYKYALVGLAPALGWEGFAELRQVSGGEDVRLSPLAGTGNSNTPHPGQNYMMRLVVEPDEEAPGHFRAALTGPGGYNELDPSLSAWMSFRSCLSITSPIVGVGTGDLTSRVDLWNASIWTPQKTTPPVNNPIDCPRSFQPRERDRVWLLEFDSGPSLGAWVVHFRSELFTPGLRTRVWRRPFGPRGGFYPVDPFPPIDALWDAPHLQDYFGQGWLVNDGHYAYWAADPNPDPYEGFELRSDVAGVPTYTCFARAIRCDEA